jgi:hypothetical protein
MSHATTTDTGIFPGIGKTARRNAVLLGGEPARANFTFIMVVVTLFTMLANASGDGNALTTPSPGEGERARPNGALGSLANLLRAPWSNACASPLREEIRQVGPPWAWRSGVDLAGFLTLPGDFDPPLGVAGGKPA